MAAVIVLWQFAPRSWLPRYAFGEPGGVARRFGDLISSGDAFTASAYTLLTLLEAVVIGAPLGVALALVASTRAGRYLLEPIITLTYAIPKVGLISLLLIWIGVNTKTHLTLAVLSILFLYYFAMRQAIGEADQHKATALRLMGASRPALIRLLTLPEATPHLLGATRSALPIGFTVVVFAEIRVSTTTDGLGQLLERYINQLDGNGSIAVVILIGLVGFLLDLVIGRRIVRFTRRTGTGLEPA